VFHYTADPAEYQRRAADVFQALRIGYFQAAIGAVHELAHVATAHTDLSARRTVGALLLRP
jgi:NADPH2:quinone reductase